MKCNLLYTVALLFAGLQTFAQTYTYDNLNRLESVVYNNGTTVTYTYDALGNRIGKKVTKDIIIKKGDLNVDGTVSITDVVMIIDVIADPITYADKKAAADVNSDGNVTITDCVAAIDLIAAQSSSPHSARTKAHMAFSNTDFISATMERGQLTVNLDNEKRFTAFQMIVNMPKGMTLGCATMDKIRGADHQVVVRNLTGGQYLVAGYSANNDEFIGNSGSLFSIVTDGQAEGDIFISDIEFATTQGEAYYLADITLSSTPTVINEIKYEDSRMKDEIYDLQGRRVVTPTKGVYIYNGKKAVIK